MKLNEINRTGCFSIKIEGKKVVLPVPQLRETGENKREETYKLQNGLTIIREVTCYPLFDAISWVLHLKNEGFVESPLITQISDCDMSFAFVPDEVLKPGFRPYDPTFKVVNSIGGANLPEDFMPREYFLTKGEKKEFKTEGGRSSSPIMPYFDMVSDKKGIITAIGWSGNWEASISRGEEVELIAGIPGLCFRLHPQEKIRTARIVLMGYSKGQNNGHNRFRRFIKTYFTPIGHNGCQEQGPVGMSVWGGVSSEEVIKRIRQVKKYNLGFEYIWMDAGWYGESKLPCPDEHSGDWGLHAGTWSVNTTYHPDGLYQVAKEVEEAGMKFLLWCEPERAISGTRWTIDHPDWYIESLEEGQKGTLLLNLGHPKALLACIELIDGLINGLNLSCYRQDFNLDPISFWNHHDEGERAGMTQIKHIMGLYTFWDTLLEHHPGLLIDNCASGGRRLDIELMSRSMPLWETDYTCIWNYDAEDVQSQNSGIFWWLPYTGTGTGGTVGDVYRFRSSYASSLACARWSYDFQKMEDDEESQREYEWTKKYITEYKRVRPYLSCDYYPLTMPSLSKDGWSVLQFDRPEQGDGVILAFRRSHSMLAVANLEFNGLLPNCIYQLEDTDSGTCITMSSEILSTGQWELCIPEKETSRILFYKCCSSS